jgi:hypothetical protein
MFKKILTTEEKLSRLFKASIILMICLCLLTIGQIYASLQQTKAAVELTQAVKGTAVPAVNYLSKVVTKMEVNINQHYQQMDTDTISHFVYTTIQKLLTDYYLINWH